MVKGDILIDPEIVLIRRAHLPMKAYSNPDGTATSRVFTPRPKDKGALSVNIKELTTYEQSIENPERYFLFQLLNRAPIFCLKTTKYDPNDDGTNNAHSVIEIIDEYDNVTPAYLAKASIKCSALNF